MENLVRITCVAHNIESNHTTNIANTANADTNGSRRIDKSKWVETNQKQTHEKQVLGSVMSLGGLTLSTSKGICYSKTRNKRSMSSRLRKNGFMAELRFLMKWRRTSYVHMVGNQARSGSQSSTVPKGGQPRLLHTIGAPSRGLEQVVSRDHGSIPAHHAVRQS